MARTILMLDIDEKTRSKFQVWCIVRKLKMAEYLRNHIEKIIQVSK